MVASPIARVVTPTDSAYPSRVTEMKQRSPAAASSTRSTSRSRAMAKVTSAIAIGSRQGASAPPSLSSA